jgi:hypothetical protein
MRRCFTSLKWRHSSYSRCSCDVVAQSKILHGGHGRPVTGMFFCRDRRRRATSWLLCPYLNASSLYVCVMAAICLLWLLPHPCQSFGVVLGSVYTVPLVPRAAVLPRPLQHQFSPPLAAIAQGLVHQPQPHMEPHGHLCSRASRHLTPAPHARGLHSSTFQLNVSAFCGIGSAFRGCLEGV